MKVLTHNIQQEREDQRDRSAQLFMWCIVVSMHQDDGIGASRLLRACNEMQTIRTKLGKAIKVTSGYRCVKHNADPKVGGSRTSRHLYGIAADWRTNDRSVNPVALGIIAAAQGFGAVGIYWHDKAAIVHTDTRGGKATWLCVQPGVYPSTTYNKFVLPTIEQGCEGAANRAATVMLQRLLGIPHDGSFGPATTKALMTAQRKHGLVPDGICGPKSWTALSGADKYL